MEDSKHLSRLDFKSLEIVFDGNILNTKFDIGGIYLEREGREYAQDITQSFRKFEDGQTTISYTLTENEDDLREIFTGNNFELLMSDFIHNMDKAEIYLNGNYTEDPDSITLFVALGGTTVKAINLTLE